MKKEFTDRPQNMENAEFYGFCWKEFVLSIPSPLMLVTTYKPDGKTNACMQAWSAFSTGNKGKSFYVLLSSVYKNGHLYKTIQDKKCAVVNFMSADLYDKCMETIPNNQWEKDELEAAGLTPVSAKLVEAPMVEECFINLECRFVWEKDFAPGDDHAVICLEVVNIHMDEDYLASTPDARCGEKSILYNIHHPVNPETFTGKAKDYIASLKPVRNTCEY